MKRGLIIGCGLISMVTCTHGVAEVYRIDNGEMSLKGINDKTYRLPQDAEGINELIDALREYVINLKQESEDLDQRKSKSQKILNKKRSDANTTTKLYVNASTFALLPIGKLRHSPGFAIYIPSNRGVQVYIADKEDGEDNGTDSSEKAHTERQLISEICKVNGNTLSGRLYIYTELPPCSEGTNTKTCVQYYEDFIKQQSDLDLYIMHTNSYPRERSRTQNASEPIQIIKEIVKCQVDDNNIGNSFLKIARKK